MDESNVDLKSVLKAFKKQRNFIGTVVLLCATTAAAISFYMLPTYQAESTLRIKQTKGLADSLLADMPVGNNANTKQLMSTYEEILKSRTVVQAVIDKTQTPKAKIPRYEEMVKKISTQPIKDTEILKVKVQASSAKEAQMVANILVETFNNHMTFLVKSEQNAVREFIGERMQESKKELEQAEAALKQYKEEQQIVAPADETKAMLDKLAAINKMAAENRVALASAGGKLSSINQQLSSEKDGFVADSPLIQQYKVKLAEAEVQLVALKQQYTEQHPQVLAVKATIAETRAKLQAEAERIVSADAPSTNPIHQELLRGKIHSEAEMSAAAAQQGAIHKAIADSNNDLRQMPAKEQGLAKVMRDAAVAQEIYIMLAKRHEEARITEARGATDVQLIDAATLPEKPIKPDKLLYITVAALIGLLSSLGIVFIREYLSNTICNERDVKRYLDLTVLGNIPDYKNTEKVSVTSLWKKITRRDTAKKHRGS